LSPQNDTRKKRNKFIAWLLSIRVLPQEKGFYKLFQKQSKEVKYSAQLLLEMVTNSMDEKKCQQILKQIETSETKGDLILGEIDTLCNEAIIPPFPEQSILMLALVIDNALDGIEGAAQDFSRYKFALKEQPPEILELAQLISLAGEKLPDIIPALQKYNHCDHIYDLMRDLEHKADDIKSVVIPTAYHKVFSIEEFNKSTSPDSSSAIAREQVRAIAIDKVITRLEGVTDDLRHIANHVKGVISRGV